MGVPSFYRWLVGKYPKVVVNAVEEQASCFDSSRPNPNGFEFDNLYLDMNGTIHPCFHPEDQLVCPTTFDEVFAAIFEYVDRIFKIVRPRKLLYMAIDGVAPRAKMNQQRARRYRTAKDAELAEAEEERLRKEFEKEGKEVLPKQEYEVSDSNVITPGTVFMDKLAKVLECYIRLRLSSDPGWKGIKVILSDSNVPGEGEHKIMSFIRLQRNLPGYNPETRHCIYGLDADLIFLALATHEIHFFILREDVLTNKPPENVMASLEVSSEQELCSLKSRQWFSKVFSANSNIPKKPYQFLNILTLREYLELDMKIEDEHVTDFERILDDFIFISFLTGNDFIPHLPSVEIHEGAIDLLIEIYKKNFKSFGGYLVDTSRIKEKKAACIKIKRVEKFIQEVKFYEEKIFQKRYNLQQRRLQRMLNEKKDEEISNDFERMHLESISPEDSDCRTLKQCINNQPGIEEIGYKSLATGTPRGSHMMSPSGSINAEHIERPDVHQNTKEMKQKLKDYLRCEADLFKNGNLDNDKVKLGCEGWKNRYYREKFSAEDPTEMEIIRKKIVEKYMEGLCWVLHYYFAGVKSWSWFYPFYYSPFASDFRGLSCPQTEFAIGKPFESFNQLMAVLPPRSSHALPKVYQKLMTGEDSTLTEFYPQDFVVDTDGKRFRWQGVCKLPSIDEEKLLSATRMLEKDLELDEVERNSIKNDKIFVRKQHALGFHCDAIKKMLQDTKVTKYRLDASSDELNGFISLDDHTNLLMTSPIRGMTDIIEDHTSSAIFHNPDYHEHIPRLLVTPPEKTITEADIVERKLWHEYHGAYPPTAYQQIYTQKPGSSNKTVPPNARNIWVAARSGWSGTGRGSPAESVPPQANPTPAYNRGNPGRARGCGRSGYRDEPNPTPTYNRGNSGRARGHGRSGYGDEPNPTPTYNRGNPGRARGHGRSGYGDEPNPTPTYNRGNPGRARGVGRSGYRDEPNPTLTFNRGNPGRARGRGYSGYRDEPNRSGFSARSQNVGSGNGRNQKSWGGFADKSENWRESSSMAGGGRGRGGDSGANRSDNRS